MPHLIHILVEPLHALIDIKPGSLLADALVLHGVEFPCGGRGVCRGCMIKVIKGRLEETLLDKEILTSHERAEGWRLCCQARPTEDMTIQLKQWSALILTDDSKFSFTPSQGLGIAVDLGTTTMVAQLLDLSSSRILATEASLNPQARFGADIMSRIAAAMAEDGLEHLKNLVRHQIALMVKHLLKSAPSGMPVVRASLVGNTVMHHLFLGYDVAALSHYPFQSAYMDGVSLKGAELGWEGATRETEVFFLPNLGGFVGSDILGVIIATRLYESKEMVGAADLGTNGEIIFGNKDRILVSSTAAGPAFEGAKISQGMRAAKGAIDRVFIDNGKLSVHVIGGSRAQGICGSGLVDAVCCCLKLGLISPFGRIKSEPLTLKEPVKLLQKDVRELQLAKGAIASGIKILMESLDLKPEEVAQFYLAGAFGNSLNVEASEYIGLLPLPASIVKAVGNAALLGAKMTLFMPEGGKKLVSSILPKVKHLSLEQSPAFQNLFVDSMKFDRNMFKMV